MNKRDPDAIPDVQNSADKRRLAIDRVGIKSIRHPVRVAERGGGVQHTVAMFNMYVNLPHHFKGTHMSRFVEILDACREQIALDQLETILERIKVKLGASRAHLEIEFPYFVEKRAPVS